MLIICIWLNTIRLTNDVDMSSMSLGFVPLYICSGIAGSLLMIYIPQCFTNIPYLQILGRDSLYIYGLHYIVISIMDKFFIGVGCAIVVLLLTLPFVMLLKKNHSLSK